MKSPERRSDSGIRAPRVRSDRGMGRGKTLDHIEQTLADAYRKEIDQEENIWRSLPFFAATIAFQFAAISHVLLRLPNKADGAWWDVSAATVLAGLCILAALWFLALSISPDRFTYVSDEPLLDRKSVV